MVDYAGMLQQIDPALNFATLILSDLRQSISQRAQLTSSAPGPKLCHFATQDDSSLQLSFGRNLGIDVGHLRSKPLHD